MADNPITTPLPADLPEQWTYGQTVGPNGTDVGLTEQHGYNYLMQQVNAAQQGVNTLGSAFSGLLPLSGGTLTGPLTLSGDPIADLQAAPKQYVDALKPKTITVTLPASGWSNNQQTVTAKGVTANNAVTPSPAPASWEAAGAAGVRCVTQGGNRLTFTCSETPTEDLTYNVLIQEVQ